MPTDIPMKIKVEWWVSPLTSTLAAWKRLGGRVNDGWWARVIFWNGVSTTRRGKK